MNLARQCSHWQRQSRKSARVSPPSILLRLPTISWNVWKACDVNGFYSFATQGLISMAAEMNNLSEEAQSLARVPLFRRLEPEELEHLAEEVDQVNYQAGETIFHEHDRGDAL